jgi:glycosyltransferase involved in cell wall biosynthesis
MALTPTELSVLFITYNRSDMLEKSFQAIKACPDLKGARVLVSDDFSKPEHIERIQRMGFDKVVLAQRNGGLGRNNNKGLRAVDTDFCLMVQDDCMLVNPKAITQALAVLKADPSVGMVRLHGEAELFPLTKRVAAGVEYWVCDHTGPEYAALKAQPGKRLRIYSDQPHVRRRSFHEKVVGYYIEGTPMEESEMDYEDRVDAQRELFVAFLNPTQQDHFIHAGGDDVSFRARKMRYRMDGFILKFVNALGLKNLPVYAHVRTGYRQFQKALMAIGVIKP